MFSRRNFKVYLTIQFLFFLGSEFAKYLGGTIKWISIRPLDNFLMNLTRNSKLHHQVKKRSRSTGPDFVQMLHLKTMSLRTVKHLMIKVKTSELLLSQANSTPTTPFFPFYALFGRSGNRGSPVCRPGSQNLFSPQL
jgi:hypothetical protein